LVIRADLAETLGLAILPWALLAAWHAGHTATPRSVALPALTMGALILTHNLTALVALPAAAAAALFAAWRAPSRLNESVLRSSFVVFRSSFSSGAAAGLG